MYKKCLQPAALTINPVYLSQWPITYSAMMTLYWDKKGRLHFGSIDFPAQLTRKLGAKLLKLFEEHDDLKDTFFVHELRGTKSSSHHNPKNADERRAAMGDVLAIFDAQLNPDQWVIDIGLEIWQEGRMCTPMANGRPLVHLGLPVTVSLWGAHIWYSEIPNTISLRYFCTTLGTWRLSGITWILWKSGPGVIY